MDVKFELDLQQAMINAIKETNRCMVINGLSILPSERLNKERLALFKTWLCREVRKYLGYAETNLFYDSSVVAFHTEGNNVHIHNIHFNIPDYLMAGTRLVALKKIVDNLDYKALKYDPGYKINWGSEYSRQKTFKDVVEEVNFDEINNILNKYNQ